MNEGHIPARVGELHDALGAQHVLEQRVIDGFVERHGGGAVDDDVHLVRQPFVLLGVYAQALLGKVAGYGHKLLPDECFEPIAQRGPQPSEHARPDDFLLEALMGGNELAAGARAGPYEQVQPAYVGGVAQDALYHGLTHEPGGPGYKKAFASKEIRDVTHASSFWKGIVT